MLEKKVLLFGRTGDGKSTVANMLVAGHLHDPVFKIGDGMAGVTGRCEVNAGRLYNVVDTVGLGEETDSERQHAKDLIYKFLKRTQGDYSHILFVKAAGRFDELDKEIWNIFLEVFQGTQPAAFGVVVTKCNNPEKWGRENQQELQNRYRECQSRFAFVNFPPVDEDDESMEALLEKKRNRSLRTLDAALDGSFQRNSFRYFRPQFASESDAKLQKRSVTIYEFIHERVTVLGSRGSDLWRAVFGGVWSTYNHLF